MKTSRQLATDLRQLLIASPLASAITGKVYLSGTRPRDSQTEDAVVIFTQADAAQVQEGVMTINLFVPDIAPRADGVRLENIARTTALEALSAQWVESLTARQSSYLFSLQQAITTDYAPELEQHIVVIRLRFRYFE